ncbi:hypothetical protein POX_d04937 [Penicillium oxalicum]|nr:hypothetical protein POX_d04937 [Penicillium oxalicum]KAI2789448.1 hypothetical protein POX_d04937 [Penicillium oxalicum]
MHWAWIVIIEGNIMLGVHSMLSVHRANDVDFHMRLE